MIGATGWAEVTRHLDDSRSSWESAEGVCVHGWSAWMEAIWMEAKWMDGGKTVTHEDKVTNGHKRPCHIY